MLRKDKPIDGEDLGKLNLPSEILERVIDFQSDLGLQFTCTFFYHTMSEKRRSIREQIIPTYLYSETLLSTRLHILILLPDLISETIKQKYSINTNDPKQYNKRLNHIGLLATLMFEAIYSLEKEYGYQYTVFTGMVELPSSHSFSTLSYEYIFNPLTGTDVDTVRKRHAASTDILKNNTELATQDNGQETLFEIMKAIHQTMHYLELTKKENTPKQSWFSFLWPEKADPFLHEKKTLNHCISLLVTAFYALEEEINATPVNVPGLNFF